jgi:ribulose-bisphosphate carboxylase large chain
VTPLAGEVDDRVMPAFSSGQWAGTRPATWAAIGHDDLLFMAGGGILAHPGGPAAGVASIRAGLGGDVAARRWNRPPWAHRALRQALDFTGGAAG